MIADPGAIKRFLLRALLSANGVPMPHEALSTAAQGAFVPKPLRSDISEMLGQLEEAGLIIADRDDVTCILSWSLTTRGIHKAKQLG